MHGGRVIRTWLLVVVLLALAAAAPAAGRSTDEDWCSGLFDHLDEHTRLSFTDEAAELGHGKATGLGTVAEERCGPEARAFGRFVVMGTAFR